MPERGLTIDELAARAGTTTRNVRAYQSRGLLPAPMLVGRVGYYGEGHLARLRLIATLQERGYSLASVGDLLRGWEQGQSIGDLLGFEQALIGSWRQEPTHFVTAEQLEAIFGHAPETLDRAVQLGLLERTEGGFRMPSASLIDAASQLLAAGIPLDEIVEEAGRLKEDAAAIAQRFVALFLRNIWEPYVRAGKPPDELARITEALRRLKPLAGATTLAFLAEALAEQAGAAADEIVSQLERLGVASQ
jgi:DNA-binding transcriptional MerR regulator